MATWKIIDLVCYSLGIAGGVALLIAPIVEKARMAARWMRVVVWMMGGWAILWATLGFMLVFHYQLSLSDAAYRHVYHYKTLAGGGGLAMGFLLVTSPEFYTAFGKRRKQLSEAAS